MNLDTEVAAAFELLAKEDAQRPLTATAQQAFNNYQQLGWPTQKLEAWKYTRVSQLVQKPFRVTVSAPEQTPVLLPQTHRLATVVTTGNQLVFVNGIFTPSLSAYDKETLELLPLPEAAQQYPEQINTYLDQSKKYAADGMQALNTAFVQNGLFIRVKKNAVVAEPVFINHYTNGQSESLFVQPRILILVEENAQVQFAECYFHTGAEESFTNEVTEITVLENARLEYYKIQDMPANAHHVGTTHIQQAGKCFTHCATITLNGGTIRNNLNMVFGKENNEGHLYGLYLVNGNTHVDNHTVVDNTATSVPLASLRSPSPTTAGHIATSK